MIGDLGRPQMFSPIRRSSLYFAEWRFDMLSSLSLRRGPVAPQVEATISTAAHASPVMGIPPRAGPAAEGAGYDHRYLRSQAERGRERGPRVRSSAASGP